MLFPEEGGMHSEWGGGEGNVHYTERKFLSNLRFTGSEENKDLLIK